MKRVKMYAPNGKGTIEVLPSRVDEMVGKGWKLKSTKPKTEKISHG